MFFWKVFGVAGGNRFRVWYIFVSVVLYIVFGQIVGFSCTEYRNHMTNKAHIIHVYLSTFTIKTPPNVGKYTVRPVHGMGRICLFVLQKNC